MPSIEELIMEWGWTSTHRDKARIEAEVWGAMRDRRRGGIGPGLSTIVDAKPKEIAIRHSLWLAGPSADPIWNRIDSAEDRMALYTAARILSDAKKQVGDDVSLSDAILGELSYYDSLDAAVMADGRVFRRRSAKKLRRGSGPPPPEDASVWTKMRAQIGRHVESILSDCDPMVANRLRQDFESDLDAAMTTFKARVRRAKMAAPPAVRREDLVEACTFFGVDPPDPGRQVPPKLAKSKWRAAARAYHPDANGGKNSRRLFETARKAYEIIEVYNESIGGRNSHA